MNNEPRPNFECPACGKKSYHPQDVKHRYCGGCHIFWPDRELSRAEVRDLLQGRIDESSFNRKTR